MKKILIIMINILIVLSLVGCAKQESTTKLNGEVTIVYTNDVHTYVNNNKEDDENNVKPLLQYSSVKALKDELISQGKDVLLLDVGDHVQGTAYGGIDEGESVVNIMNAVGYDAATIGNHEFDYGQYQGFNLLQNVAKYPYVSCNFYEVKSNKTVFDAYKVFEKGGLKIAIVGISTPETITKSAPAYFQDSKGNYIYGFYGGEDGKELYDVVQKAVDEARKEADIVIALGHLGIDVTSKPWRSIDVIANVSGLDAFIDGHSHNLIEGEKVKDKDGKDVLLTQAGQYLENIGVMTLMVKDGVTSISTKMISEFDKRDVSVDALTTTLVEKVQTELGKVICKSDVDLLINEQGSDERIIRKMETNLGDMVADGYYYYFNEIENIDVDVAIANGGCIRSELLKGDLTYGDLKTVLPFGNVGCAVSLSGQMLLDAIEFASRASDGIPIKTNEVGGFLHVAGAKYTIDTTIESTIQMDENQIFTGAPIKEYRVKDLQIYNKETKQYEPVDLDKYYVLAGVNYILRDSGDGFSMLGDTNLVKDYCDQDYLLFASYCSSFTNGTINSANSPLASYEGYLLNYEDPHGSGRITFIK